MVSDVQVEQVEPTTGDARDMLTRKIYVEAFGCQMNFHDSERLAGTDLRV